MSTLTLTLHDVRAGDLPDVDTDVLIWDESSPEAQLGALVSNEPAEWVEAHGAPVEGVVFWAEMPRSGERQPEDPGVAVYWRDPFAGDAPRVLAVDLYQTVEHNLAAAARPSLTITLRQAEALVGFFGGHDAEVTITMREAGEIKPDSPGDAPSPAGLWVHLTEYPEEGSAFLGATEVDEARGI